MFALPFDIPENPVKIKSGDPIFAIGSCFSDNIGEKLKTHKFAVVTNPLGTIYNPHSIFKGIRLLLTEGLAPDNYTQVGGVYYHWDTHSAISETSMGTFRQLIEKISRESRQHLTTCKWIIVTLGTSYVYRHLDSGQIVANCHKVPGKAFEKQSLTASEIVADYFRTMKVVRHANPDTKVILTVSPVRHIRDGLIQNNVSKAILINAVNEITNTDPETFYFPSYELMIDVLRDYRFYREDMIHPADQAIDYIWERFVHTFTDRETAQFIEQWSRIRKSLAHRPFHPDAPAHQNFLKATIKQLKALEGKVDVSPELEELEKQLKQP